MKGFKAYQKGLLCRGKQYKENEIFEEDDAKICSKGMHFCENPFDVLKYYDLVNDDGTFNDFTEVESLDECLSDDGEKFCTKKLKIFVKLGFSGFVNACVDFIIEKTITNAKSNSSGDSAQIGSSGHSAKIGSSGYSAQIGSSGDSAQIGCTGRYSVICCAGHDSRVKAKVGSWITLSEWKYDEEKKVNIPICVKTEYVDGERIKADTTYKLSNGVFVEV